MRSRFSELLPSRRMEVSRPMWQECLQKVKGSRRGVSRRPVSSYWGRRRVFGEHPNVLARPQCGHSAASPGAGPRYLEDWTRAELMFAALQASRKAWHLEMRNTHRCVAPDGTGHVMRCLTLAQELRRHGGRDSVHLAEITRQSLQSHRGQRIPARVPPGPGNRRR